MPRLNTKGCQPIPDRVTYRSRLIATLDEVLAEARAETKKHRRTKLGAMVSGLQLALDLLEIWDRTDGFKREEEQ